MSAIASRIDPAAASGSPVDAAIERFYESVVRTKRVDPLTTEIVRLRCAGYHGCRFCASVRDAQALELGLDEALVRKLADYERSDLPERWKAALRLADALMIAPGSVAPALSAQLHEHFTDAQIAELIFDVMKFSVQKVGVSLRTEPPANERALTTIVYDELGRWSLGEQLPQAAAVAG